jgi:hypothetical protein
MTFKELYPENFTNDDKIEFDVLLAQSLQLYPQFQEETWLAKLAVIDYIQKKNGRHEPSSLEFVEKIRNMYVNLPNSYETPLDNNENTIVVE